MCVTFDASDGRPSPLQTAYFAQQVSSVALLNVPQEVMQVRTVHYNLVANFCCACNDVLDNARVLVYHHRSRQPSLLSRCLQWP